MPDIYVSVSVARADVANWRAVIAPWYFHLPDTVKSGAWHNSIPIASQHREEKRRLGILTISPCFSCTTWGYLPFRAPIKIFSAIHSVSRQWRAGLYIRHCFAAVCLQQDLHFIKLLLARATGYFWFFIRRCDKIIIYMYVNGIYVFFISEFVQE